eukprot:COSAG01_NODE_941_length_12576_cov_118.998557_5_plen_449_part_00
MNRHLYLEGNIDSLVGPSHFYAGLAFGNLAAMQHKGLFSSPKQAALEGLNKMKHLMDLGVPQLVLPPAERPHIEALRELGFSGSDELCLKKAYQESRQLFLACTSASSMWTANAATMTPSCDSRNHRAYLTLANLSQQYHRALEVDFSKRLFERIFAKTHLNILPPLAPSLQDEGAANHHRICVEQHQRAVHLFVYGKESLGYPKAQYEKFPCRQSKEASESIARRHHLSSDQIVCVQQHPDSVEKGAFHADVILMGHRYVLICHEKSFKQQRRVLQELRKKTRAICQVMPIIIEIKSEELSLEESVASYFFNSQIITLPNGEWAIILPQQCQQNTRVLAIIQRILAGRNPIKKVYYVNVNQSMFNGGGPACLRLRMILPRAEWAKVHTGVKLNIHLYHELCQWVCHFYPDTLNEQQLISPKFLSKSRQALDELSKILNLTGIYSFQH